MYTCGSQYEVYIDIRGSGCMFSGMVTTKCNVRFSLLCTYILCLKVGYNFVCYVFSCCVAMCSPTV